MKFCQFRPSKNEYTTSCGDYSWFDLTQAKHICKNSQLFLKIFWEATVKASGTLNFWRGNDKRLSEQWLAIRNDMLHEPLESPLQSTSFKSIIFLQEIILDKYDAKIAWFIRHRNYEKCRLGVLTSTGSLL